MDGSSAALALRGDLPLLARGVDAAGRVAVGVGGGRTVKDAVEGCGVPHTEVGALTVDGGAAVGFDHRLQAGELVVVHPVREAAAIAPLLRPAPLPEQRFVCDVHLGRLAQLLRLLGFDTCYERDRADPELARCAVAERRWLLSRDRGLLKRRVVSHGQLLRSDDPREQLREVARRHRLGPDLAPRTRCARCNGLLAPVAKDEIADRLEPGTRAAHDRFARCGRCGQLYWEGSHTPALEALAADVRAVGGGGAVGGSGAVGGGRLSP